MRRVFRGLSLVGRSEIASALRDQAERLKTVELVRSRNPGAKIHADVILLSHDLAKISIAEGASIELGTILSGGNSDGHGTIEVGRDTWIGQYNNIRAGDGDIHIGENCLISQFCSVIGTNHGTARGELISAQQQKTQTVTIGADVWLGAGVIVLPGAQIGDGAVIAANAVVTSEVPPYEVWGGVPARKIRERE